MSLRFGLGALLVATALFASVFAWFAAHARQSTVEDKALAALDELNDAGFSVDPGQLGENITTRGIDLPSLPRQTKLSVGEEVIVELTALRNPCVQIDEFQKGLLKETIHIDDNGNPSLKGGVMGVVLSGGTILPGDSIVAKLPAKPFDDLEYVW